MSTNMVTMTLRGKTRRGGYRPYVNRHKAKVTFPPLQHPYTDDDADLELKSEDGVIFKVESFYLKAASGAFRSMLTSSAAAHGASTTNADLALLNENITMLDTPTTSSTTSKQPPIEISCPSLILRLFIDLMHHAPLLSDPRDSPILLPDPVPTPRVDSQLIELSDPSPRISSAHFTDLFRPANAPLRGRANSITRLTYLLDILDQFECGIGMRERALAHFEPNFDVDPWGVFVIAGRYDDLELAKKAIGKFGEIPLGEKYRVEPKTMPTDQAGRVPLEWLMAYWRAHGDVKQERQDQFFWGFVAEKFAPKPSGVKSTSK